MKVRLKKNKKCNSLLSHDKEYIVMAIETYLPKNETRYFVRDDMNLKVLHEALLFDLVDDIIPKEWVVKILPNLINCYSIFVGFEEFTSSDFFYNIITYEGEESTIFNRRLREQEKWYYDKEIDDFFAQEDLDLTQEQRESMKQYYKTQSDLSIWKREKEELFIKREFHRS